MEDQTGNDTEVPCLLSLSFDSRKIVSNGDKQLLQVCIDDASLWCLLAILFIVFVLIVLIVLMMRWSTLSFSPHMKCCFFNVCLNPVYDSQKWCASLFSSCSSSTVADNCALELFDDHHHHPRSSLVENGILLDEDAITTMQHHVSHQLRTASMAIGGSLDILKEFLDQETVAQDDSSSRSVYCECRHHPMKSFRSSSERLELLNYIEQANEMLLSLAVEIAGKSMVSTDR
ncbi:hypothetical protein FDP41_011010 [Naegleria fowleri]|uniref:Uncharacterized protein n=1 Tax=Naegleria fowleri TaxID=5763 RepID=A0A6A5C7Z5_NAEFO|nr:uncharacterized protein FDP41_011010 [Naegleria fowleri]KAF0983032.1 hypothetical protein FDP41_011010 [Naegleria fowleri]CAG4708409.1 unnamed protein product [Naegleria fowleri]